MSIYAYTYENARVTISRDDSPWFTIPCGVKVNDVLYTPPLSSCEGNTLIFSDAVAKLTYTFLDDSIEVDFRLTCAKESAIYEAFYFADGQGGLGIGHFNRSFTPQPKNNNHHNMAYYMNLPDCSLKGGYFSPSILNFLIGNEKGNVAFGLLDLPDSFHYKMVEDFSILVESCGGNKVIKAGDAYQMPKLLLTFPETEWDSIPLFRQKLIDYGRYTPKRPTYAEIPAWWKDPIICTYGDELSTLCIPDVRMNEPEFNADWVREIVRTAEEEWGIEHMTIVLDAFWQIQFALDPQVDTARFGNMRDFVDEMHARGHHVLAWITPLFDSIANGFETRSQRLGVLSPRALSPLGVDGSFSIDLTHDNASQYYREVCQVLFGQGEGEYNLDGVKLDYMGLQRDPALHGPYAHPEKGMGIGELMLFYEMFYAAAKAAKADAIVNCSTTDPRFEHLIDMNRLHDTHVGNIEKEMRAKISTLACPDLLIDSDGALMYTDWAKAHYTCAMLYSVPANYYTFRYHDRKMDDVDIPRLGRLLQMAKYRPNGHAICESFGNWTLIDGENRVNALTQNGHTLVYYPCEDQPIGHIFTWQNEGIVLPLHGRHIGKLTPEVPGLQVDYARDQAILRLKPGVIYTFEDIDEGNGHERIFKKQAAAHEADVEYSNG